MFTRKDLAKLLLPLIVEQLLAVLVGMADVVMVAAVGETAVSGVSLVDSISILIIQMLAALATGGSVVCAQYIGKKQPENACEAAGQLILVTTMVSVVIAVIALIGNRHLLAMIFGKVENSVMENAQIYFWLSALSYPFLAVYNSCAALYRAMGNSKVSMYASLVMNAINIAGNAICVFGLHMGVEGVGIPTLVSRAFAAILMLFLIQRPQNVIRIRNLQELRFNGRMIKDILKVGVPNGMENTMFQFGKLFLQSLVSSLGTVAIASYAVASNLVTFEYLVGNAIGLGIITSPIMLLFCVILMGYAVLKVFFANLKRGGILLIQIAVGSLYMFSVPRGYLDGFMGWMRQVIGLCLTAFLQSTILIAGLMVFKDHALMGVGLMLSAGEVPRIAGSFGVDTTTKANITSAVYTAQSAVNVTRTIAAAIK